MWSLQGFLLLLNEVAFKGIVGNERYASIRPSDVFVTLPCTIVIGGLTIAVASTLLFNENLNWQNAGILAVSTLAVFVIVRIVLTLYFNNAIKKAEHGV